MVSPEVVPPVDPAFELRINAGGPALTYEGKDFAADTYFVGGKTYTNSSASLPTLYQTERSSTTKTFAYEVPLANGDYQVVLHFAEIYWGVATGVAGGSGKRVFNVNIEGDPVLSSFDINAEAAPGTVLTKTIDVTVSDGELTMNFSAQGGADQPKLSAFEVIEIDGSGLRTNQQQAAPLLVASPMEGSGPLMVKFSGDLLGTADPELSYYWDFGDGNASKEKNPVNIFTEPGVYEVKARIGKYGIPLYTETVMVTVWDESQDQDGESVVEQAVTIAMYPNPASTFVNLRLDHPTEQIAEVRIFDLRGRLVNTFVPAEDQFSKSYEISVNDLAAGLYFVSTITDSGYRDMQRLIIVR